MVPRRGDGRRGKRGTDKKTGAGTTGGGGVGVERGEGWVGVGIGTFLTLYVLDFAPAKAELDLGRVRELRSDAIY
jgi:hypothetical protein